MKTLLNLCLITLLILFLVSALNYHQNTHMTVSTSICPTGTASPVGWQLAFVSKDTAAGSPYGFHCSGEAN